MAHALDTGKAGHWLTVQDEARARAVWSTLDDYHCLPSNGILPSIDLLWTEELLEVGDMEIRLYRCGQQCGQLPPEPSLLSGDGHVDKGDVLEWKVAAGAQTLAQPLRLKAVAQGFRLSLDLGNLPSMLAGSAALPLQQSWYLLQLSGGWRSVSYLSSEAAALQFTVCSASGSGSSLRLGAAQGFRAARVVLPQGAVTTDGKPSPEISFWHGRPQQQAAESCWSVSAAVSLCREDASAAEPRYQIFFGPPRGTRTARVSRRLAFVSPVLSVYPDFVALAPEIFAENMGSNASDWAASQELMPPLRRTNFTVGCEVGSCSIATQATDAGMMARVLFVLLAAAVADECPLEGEETLLMQLQGKKESVEYEADQDGPRRDRRDSRYSYNSYRHYSPSPPASTTEPSDPSTTTAAPAPPPVLKCEDAEPQAPRNVTCGFVGEKKARVKPLDTDAVFKFIQANLHFHLGAEHLSAGEYDLDSPPPGVEKASSVALGKFCGLCDIPAQQLQPFDFEHCKNVSVGNTYEFHWVFSTGAPLVGLRDDGEEGQLGITDGLGGALNRTINPKVIVRGQACRIINNASLDTEEKIGADYADFLTQWRQPPLGQGVRYMGSTTGNSLDDEVCSPIEVNWHVDTKCCTLSAQAFDRTCKAMYDEGLREDLKPKGSRAPVSAANSATVIYPLSEPACS
ncbi:unnamed protein product [Effrenium voratum]|nr:unnamed protein product [Effrenium voratum]